MDNYAWVEELSEKLHEQGQHRLAQLIHDIPMHKYEGNHALVDAEVPEALAAARSLEIPWLDVYFKHWLCASRIDRLQGELVLGDVVSAYESAHQEKTQGCPQSVCVTQDLVGTYANVDGPGWAVERIAAVDETMARIDPSWSCFGCLSIERATAMSDQGQPREAVMYLQRQRAEQLEAGEEPNSYFVLTEVEQWLALGDSQTAWKRLEESEDAADEDDEGEQMTRRLLRCRALAMNGEAEAAIELMPDFDDDIEVEKYLLWARAAVALARVHPESNDEAFGKGLWTVIEHLHRVGSHRLLIDCAIAQAETSIARGIPWLAQLAVARAREHVPLLREDLGAGAKVEQAAQQVKAAKSKPAPCAHAELSDWLDSSAPDDLDNEQAIQWLMDARTALPADEDIAMDLSRALSNFGAHEEARSRLQAMALAAPESIALQNNWFALCFKAEDMAAIEEQARRIDAAQPSLAAWFRARVAFHEERFAEVGPFVAKVLEIDADAHPTRALWADAALQLKDFDTAYAQRRLLLESQESPDGRVRWDVLVAASATGHWADVREQAKALEMELDDVDDVNLPVEEDWGLVYLRYTINGDEFDLLARRTGPATARILQPARYNMEQRMGDWVVFVPKLVEQPPEDAEALEHYVRIFEQPLGVLQSGGFGPTYMVDGVHPGEEEVRALRDALEAEGWGTWQYSTDHYRVTDPDAEVDESDDEEDEDASEDDDEDDIEDNEGDDNEGSLPGVYLAVCAPTGVSPKQMSALLARVCKGKILCWAPLARAAGEPADWHEEIEGRYDL